MTTYNKQELLKEALESDEKFTMDITGELLGIGTLLGSQAPLFRGFYKTLRKEGTYYESKPKIGAEVQFSVDYQEQLVTYTRLTTKIVLSSANFLRLLGWIDACYSTIYPIGTIAELDVELLPEPIRQRFEEEPGALVLLVGRKIPLGEGFSDYVVDYLAHLWPFGELPGIPPIYVSNPMIKRVVSMGMTNELEEKFALQALRRSCLAQGQISTAFMPRDTAISFYEQLQRERVVE